MRKRVWRGGVSKKLREERVGSINTTVTTEVKGDKHPLDSDSWNDNLSEVIFCAVSIIER